MTGMPPRLLRTTLPAHKTPGQSLSLRGDVKHTSAIQNSNLYFYVLAEHGLLVWQQQWQQQHDSGSAFSQVTWRPAAARSRSPCKQCSEAAKLPPGALARGKCQGDAPCSDWWLCARCCRRCPLAGKTVAIMRGSAFLATIQMPGLFQAYYGSCSRTDCLRAGRKAGRQA